MTTNECRNFLKQLAAGGLLLGVGARVGAVERQGSGAVSVAATVNGWARITPSGEVTLLTNTSEIGQGTGTALAQILAEELDQVGVVVRHPILYFISRISGRSRSESA